jgi:polysaccharide biosynthesis protein PslG
MITRRGFLRSATGSAAAISLFSSRVLAADSVARSNLLRLGRLNPRSSKSIQASPLSIGFETLDRRQFDPKRTYEHLGRLGVKWARPQTGWCRCETEKGKYDFRWLDEVVDSLHEQGIHCWFNLGYGNKLYIPEAPDVSAVGFPPVFTQEARNGWAAFVDAIAEHFADRVKRWEIWNEPNGFWRPKGGNAAAYVEFVKTTAPRIRSRISDAVIIGGAIACCQLKFMTECLEAGLATHVDRISFHPYASDPYPPNPEEDEAFVVAVRKQLAERGASVKLWQGECGCPSDPNTEDGTDPKGRKVSEQMQAKWLLRRILTDLRQELDLTSYFTTVDLTHYNWGNGPTNHAQSYGVLRGTDYSPKPSYYAYQSLCSLFDAQTKHDRGARITADKGAKQLTTAGFVRNGRSLHAYWLATDLLDPFNPGIVSLRLSTSASATIERPVLFDPLSQQAYVIQGAVRNADELAVANLPAFDYPLIVTDQSVVPISS